MKKPILILCMSILASSVFAQFGVMTVSSNNNQKFWLFIDDVLQNEYSTHAMLIQGMQYIPYRIRVEMDNQDFNCVGQTVVISNNPRQNNFIITRDRTNNYFFGKTQGIVIPFFVQTVILPNYSYYSGYQQFLYPGFNANVSYGQGNQHRGNAYKRPQGGGYGQGNPNPNQGNPNSGYGNPNPGHGNPNPGHNNPQVYCMPDNDFNQALKTIKNASSDNAKALIAKQIATQHNLCVSQITQMCKQFTFDDGKLDFAKHAYPYCVDKNNYYQVCDAFTFSSTKEQLMKFISSN